MRTIVLLLTFILMSCQSVSKKENMESNINKTWTIVGFSPLTKSQLASNKAYINFGEDGKGTATVGCNTMGFTYVLSGDKISFSNFRSTRMYCETLQEAESKLAGALGESVGFKLTNKTLLITGANSLLVSCSLAE